MPLPLNYTTNIDATRTATEVQTLLAAAGADAIGFRYQDRAPIGVSFMLDTPTGLRTFELPISIDGILALLNTTTATAEFRRRKVSGAKYQNREHAARVAWRIAKDWLEAQLALIAAGMATLDQVMLPYLVTGDGRTLYDDFRTREITN